MASEGWWYLRVVSARFLVRSGAPLGRLLEEETAFLLRTRTYAAKGWEGD